MQDYASTAQKLETAGVAPLVERAVRAVNMRAAGLDDQG